MHILLTMILLSLQMTMNKKVGTDKRTSMGTDPIAIKLSILNEKIPFFGYTSLGIN